MNLPTIRNELGTVLDKTSQIGVQLGLLPHKIREFQKKDDPMGLIIEFWLGGNVEGVTPSWQSIVTALKSDHVGEIGLGNRIHERYCLNKGHFAALNLSYQFFW